MTPKYTEAERAIWIALPICDYIKVAQRIIRSLDQAGYEIVPKERTTLIKEWGEPLKDGDSVAGTFTVSSEAALLCVNCGLPEKRHVHGTVWNEIARRTVSAHWCPGGDNGRGDGLHTEWEPKAPGEPVQVTEVESESHSWTRPYKPGEAQYAPDVVVGGYTCEHFDREGCYCIEGADCSCEPTPEQRYLSDLRKADVSIHDAPAPKAKVTLFKPSGKYYTHEEWRIPDNAIQPHEMERSLDFHRVSGGPVLVHAQEPWGYPVLLVAPVEREDGGF